MPSEHQEQKEAEKRSAVPASTIHEAIVIQGSEELSRTSRALFWSGLAGGFSMSASFLAEALLRAFLPDSEWTRPISKLGYPVGFLIVVLGRHQLFTENTLTAVLPLLKDGKLSTFRNVVRLWTIVLVANLIGAHIAAWFFGNTPAVGRDIQTAMHEIGSHAMRNDFTSALTKGIVAGWLIAMVVWLSTATQNSKVAAIFVPTYVVGLGSFTHVIAGSTEVLFLVMTGSLAWPTYLMTYMIPSLIGNCLGGVLLVTALDHAQVAADNEKS